MKDSRNMDRRRRFSSNSVSSVNNSDQRRKSLKRVTFADSIQSLPRIKTPVAAYKIDFQLKPFKKSNKAKVSDPTSIPMSSNYEIENFKWSNGQDFTCHRLNSNSKRSADTNKSGASNHQIQIDFCGSCNTCQIVERLNNLKQWFDRANLLAIRQFIIGLLYRIDNHSIYLRIEELLKPLSESKDFVYARNKFLPSCDEDQSKMNAGNRCLDPEFVRQQVNDIWTWYECSSGFVKLNFMLSVLNKCDQPMVQSVIFNLKKILDKYQMRAMSSDDEKFLDDSDYEMICDAYDEEDLDDQEVKNIFREAGSGVSRGQTLKRSRNIDFIRQLPVHLSKMILSSLNKKSLGSALLVSKYWYNLAREVHKASFLKKIRQDDIMLLKGMSSKTCNPRFASNTDVRVPNLYPGTNELIRKPNESEVNITYKTDCSWSNAFAGFETRNIIMEERNVFCGPFNVLLLKEKRDPHRVVHSNGASLVAYGSFDKKIRFIDIKTTSEKSLVIQGHAGSIKCIYICEKKKIVVTGSFDTSIRCWSIETGKCIRMYHGHQQTVNCVYMYDADDRIVSGSNDNTARVWNLAKKKPWRIFKHTYPIVSVALSDTLCLSGGQNGKIKVFTLLEGKLLKTIVAHKGPVKSIKFDRWHIVTCGIDNYALVYSTQGKHKKCMVAMRHPKEVYCVEFQYLRAITGCSDGKVRIWNILNGECIRVVRGNSQCDAILSLCIVDNRILINTENNILLMEFEKIIYEYNSTSSLLTEEQKEAALKMLLKKRRGKTYSAIRASRSELIGTPNVKLFNNIPVEQSENAVALEHSARPISGRNLRDAHIMNTITTNKSANVNLARNSAGHVSELALQRRFNLLQSINAAASGLTSAGHRTSMSMNSSTNTTTSGSGGAKSNAINDAESQANLANIEKHRETINKLKELEILKNKQLDLNETKNYLREQLKEIKELEQQPAHIKAEIQRAEQTDLEMKSCVETQQLDMQKKKIQDIGMKLIRPTSSPSRVDTKTKIKMRQRDLDRVNAMKLDENTEELLNETLGFENNLEDTVVTKNVKFSDSVGAQKEKPVAVEVTAVENQDLKFDDFQAIEESKTEVLVTKMFQIHEKEHETNTRMYPTNVKSKLPNQKIINSIRPATAFTKAKSINSLVNKMAVSGEKSPRLVPILFNKNKAVMLEKQKLVRPHTSIVTMPPESNKLFNGSQLNLMTSIEVDELVKTIDRSKAFIDEYEKERDLMNKRMYKKLWLMKSKGEYHGNLMAQTKSVAPEIRE